jgi:hypothetical protein
MVEARGIVHGWNNPLPPVVRELGRDCALTEQGADGRTRHKLRGRVYKGKDRKRSGEEAEWVVLGIVHRAVAVLREINDDPGHLFGYDGGGRNGHVLLSNMPKRIRAFRDHLNELFSTTEELYIPLRTATTDEHTGTRADVPRAEPHSESRQSSTASAVSSAICRVPLPVRRGSGRCCSI